LAATSSKIWSSSAGVDDFVTVMVTARFKLALDERLVVIGQGLAVAHCDLLTLIVGWEPDFRNGFAAPANHRGDRYVIPLRAANRCDIKSSTRR